MNVRYACLLLAALPAMAQPAAPCEGTRVYSPCEIGFELSAQEAAAHPNPYASVQLHGEFRSPDHRTTLMPAYWDGGNRMVIRFTPTEPGAWDYRLTSNLSSLEGKAGHFTIAESDLPGFVVPRNVHHWAYQRMYTLDLIPHLWMGAGMLDLAGLDAARFNAAVDARASQHFNHVRALVLASGAYTAPDRPNAAYFQSLDRRIAYLNSKGITADLVLAGPSGAYTRQFPDWQARQRYLDYVIARYAPYNMTWQGLENFETYSDGRALLKDMGQYLKQHDPYGHPRGTGTLATSAPLLDDGWMSYVSYHSSDDQLGSIEHQLYAVPFVNLDFGTEGAVSADEFRHRLWNSTMDGQYPTYNGTDPALPETAGSQQMKAWYEFFTGNRHWELEPYFDVDGGRGVALDGVEYIVYVEKPGPVEVLVEKHGYEVAWINPANGERTREKKGYHGEHFVGQPPDNSHDWVLHIYREGTKESMLRSYKFESRRIEMQVIEQNPPKVPFEIAQPAADTLVIGKPAPFEAKITRPTHATRRMMWLWTGEVAAGGQGYRVLGTGAQGTLTVPPGLARNFPAVLSLRLYGMNAVGKVYALDKTFQLSQ